MAEVFYIVNWPYHEHRDMPRGRTLRWIKAKVDFQGMDWAKLATERYASDALAAWEIIRGLAALSPYRGLLLQDGHLMEPHTVRSMALQAHWREQSLARGLGLLLERIGWVGKIRDFTDPVAASRSVWHKVYSSKTLHCGAGRKSNVSETLGDMRSTKNKEEVRRSSETVSAQSSGDHKVLDSKTMRSGKLPEKPRSPSQSPSPVSDGDSQSLTHRSTPRARARGKDCPRTETANGGEREKLHAGDGERDGENDTANDSGIGWPAGSFKALMQFVDQRVDPRRGVNAPTTWLADLRERMPDILRHDPVIVLGTLLDLRFAKSKPRGRDELQRRLFWRLNHGIAPSGRHYGEAKRQLGLAR